MEAKKERHFSIQTGTQIMYYEAVVLPVSESSRNQFNRRNVIEISQQK